MYLTRLCRAVCFEGEAMTVSSQVRLPADQSTSIMGSDNLTHVEEIV